MFARRARARKRAGNCFAGGTVDGLLKECQGNRRRKSVDLMGSGAAVEAGIGTRPEVEKTVGNGGSGIL